MRARGATHDHSLTLVTCSTVSFAEGSLKDEHRTLHARCWTPVTQWFASRWVRVFSLLSPRERTTFFQFGHIRSWGRGSPGVASINFAKDPPSVHR